MIIFPAIDLKEGRCVRLEQGDMARATIFNDDPADQARPLPRRASGICTLSIWTVPLPERRQYGGESRRRSRPALLSRNWEAAFAIWRPLKPGCKGH